MEPRSELDLLRATMESGVAEGAPIGPMISALASLDPVACAELVAGPRAMAHPAIVEASLGAAAQLETVLPPSGLYRRLVDLVPESLEAVIRAAWARHPAAPWIWRLSSMETLPGRTALELAIAKDPEQSPMTAMELGFRAAVVEVASTGHAPALRALYHRAPRESLVVALAAALECGAPSDVVAWVAAWHGPDVDPLFAVVARRLTTTAAEERLGRLAWALPATLSALS